MTLSLYLYFFLRRPHPALVLLLLEATSDQSLLLREFPDQDNVDNDNNSDNNSNNDNDDNNNNDDGDHSIQLKRYEIRICNPVVRNV